MYMVCTQEGGHWFVADRFDDLGGARELKSILVEQGLVCEVIVRGKKGYYIVQDDGSTAQLSHPESA